MRKTLSIPVIFLIVLLMFQTFSVAIGPVLAEGKTTFSPGWLSGWVYRKSHVISQATGAGTNYQVKIIVHSGLGTSSGNDVYLDGHCTSFPNDIDFTSDDGTTQLSFWIEDPTTDPITVWVRVAEDLGTADRTFYIYYGKSGQSSLSSGDNTFLFYEHFLGSSVPPTGWTLTVIGTKQFSEEQANSWFRLYNFISSSAAWAGRYLDKSISPITGGFHATAKVSSGVKAGADGESILWFQLYNDSTLNFRCGFVDPWISSTGLRSSSITGTGYESGDSTEDGAIDAIVEIEKAGAIGTAKTYYNGVQIQSEDNVSAGFNKIDFDLGAGQPANYQEAKVDYVYIRSFVYPEPSMTGAWGSEEIPRWVTFCYNMGGLLRVDDVAVANGTQNVCGNGTTTELLAVVQGNLTYGFANFTWNGNSSVSNPFNLLVTTNLTVWCYFAPIPSISAPSIWTSVSPYLLVLAIVIIILVVAWVYYRWRIHRRNQPLKDTHPQVGAGKVP